jgi:hypothetical protein
MTPSKSKITARIIVGMIPTGRSEGDGETVHKKDEG